MKINALNLSIAAYYTKSNNINFQKKKANIKKPESVPINNSQNAAAESILKTKEAVLAESKAIQKQAEIDLKKGQKKADEVTALYQKGLDRGFKSFKQGNRIVEFSEQDIFGLVIKEYNPEKTALLRKTEFSLLSNQPKQITEYIGSTRNEYDFITHPSESEVQEKPVILKIKKGIEPMTQGLVSVQKELTFDKNANLRRYIKGHKQTPVSDIYSEHFFFTDNRLSAYSQNEESQKTPKTTIELQLLFKNEDSNSFTCIKDIERTPIYSRGEMYIFKNGELVS